MGSAPCGQGEGRNSVVNASALEGNAKIFVLSSVHYSYSLGKEGDTRVEKFCRLTANGKPTAAGVHLVQYFPNIFINPSTRGGGGRGGGHKWREVGCQGSKQAEFSAS